MAYCPTCTATYSDDDYLCPDCEAALVRGPRPGSEGRGPGGFVELYRCWNAIEAELLAGLLAERGIRTHVRSMALPGYPLTIAPFAERRLAVDAASVNAARRIIVRAIADGFVSGDGGWIRR